MQISLRVQLNTTLFAKTLLRKDIASSSPKSEDVVSEARTTFNAQAPPLRASEGDFAEGDNADDSEDESPNAEVKKGEDDFSNKSQIMTLMTTDVDRVADFSWHAFALVDAPIEIIIGTYYLYHLLGSVSSSEPVVLN